MSTLGWAIFRNRSKRLRAVNVEESAHMLQASRPAARGLIRDPSLSDGALTTARTPLPTQRPDRRPADRASRPGTGPEPNGGWPDLCPQKSPEPSLTQPKGT